MTNAKYVHNLEFNRDRIINGYIKYHKDVTGLMPDGFLRFDITDKYSKKKKPGVTLGQLVSISYERAVEYANMSDLGKWADEYKTFLPEGYSKALKVVYQTNHFVICKYNGAFSIFHIGSRGALRHGNTELKAIKIVEAISKFDIWDFTTFKEFGDLSRETIQNLTRAIYDVEIGVT